MHGSRAPCIVLVPLVAMLLAGLAAEGVELAPEYTGQRIVAVEFRCAAPIDRQGLLRLLPFSVGDALSAGPVEEAQRRLMETDVFTDVSIEPRRRDGGVTLVIRLVRKPVINAIRFRGNHAISADALRRTVRLREGTTLTAAEQDHAVRRIGDRYVAEGFDAAQVHAVIRTRDPGEVDVNFDINEGPPLRIAAVDIEGGAPVAPDDIRRAAGIKPGARYVRARQRLAQAAITRLFRKKGYYEVDVDSRWELGQDRRGTLRFTINPGPLFRLRFSGNHRFKDQRLLTLMNLSSRPIITDGTWRELARRAQRLYQENGYYFARVELHIDAGPPKVVQFDVTEDGVFHVAQVSFDGIHGLSSRLLRQQMATQPPSWIPWRRGFLLDDVLDDDLKRLWFFYRQKGFESAEITDVRTRFDREHGKAFVTVYVEEGRQTIVRHVEHVGFEAVAGKLPEAHVTVGEPLNPDQVEVDRHALLMVLAQAGYTESKVNSEVITTPGDPRNAATVRFMGTAGEQQRIGALIAQNNIETRAQVLLREVPVKPGDPLNPDALLRGQTNIYRLGIFRSVTVRPLEAPAGQTVHDIGVSVSEKPAGTVQWGAGYNTSEGFRAFAEIAYSNLQGLARRLSLRGEFNFNPSESHPDEYLGNVGFRDPRLGDTLWSWRANLIAQRSTRSIDQFSLERLAFLPAVERTILPGLHSGFELQAEQANVFDVASDVQLFNPRDDGRLTTIGFGPFAVFDGRDDAFAPHRGVFDVLRFRYAPGALGTDVPFVKLTWQHSHYIPLGADLTYVYAVRGGWARAFKEGEQLPIRERFFLGGRTTVRGFGENDVGPRGSFFVNSQGQTFDGHHPLGGDLALNLNSELRFPLVYGLGGLVFVDGGGVYLQDRAITLPDFRRSAGLGIQYVTPVGPMSLLYGFKLDRRTGESVGEVHFSIGNIF